MSYIRTPRREPELSERRPGRPLNREHTEKILRSVYGLISEGKPVTLRAAIEASGVSRAAIYRRWPSMADLTAEALDINRADFSYHFIGPVKTALTSILIDDLSETVGREYTVSDFRRHFEMLMANPALHQAYFERHTQRRLDSLKSALKLAQDRGEIRQDADVEAAIDTLMGSILFQWAVRGEDFDSSAAQNRSRACFDLIWRGLEK